MVILGIDPGYDRVGWAVLSQDKGKESLLSCDCMFTSKEDSVAQRLQAIYEQLLAIIERYHPQKAVIEKLFFATNAKTVIPVAQARGVILLACQQHNIEIHEYTPLQIKSALTGNGHADKKSVEKMVRLIVKNLPENVIDDAIDAVAMTLMRTDGK